MNAYNKIIQAQERFKTSLCVGIDPDISKMPSIFPKNAIGMTEFVCKIIDATKDIASSYKLNFAFFEYFGSEGIKAMEKVLSYIPPTSFTIADAKRSDIGNSSKFYAEAILKNYNFDSITVNPLMGKDSLEPFFAYEDKMVFLLGITSNAGANDFLKFKNNDYYLFQAIIEKSRNWFSEHNLGFVVGATQVEEYKLARAIAPNNFFLIPGVGAQGGNIDEIKKYGLNPCIINVSRDILYASNHIDFAEKARKKAIEYSKLF
jgi:orotidine-5'-phosphate decarboxylase